MSRRVTAQMIEDLEYEITCIRAAIALLRAAPRRYNKDVGEAEQLEHAIWKVIGEGDVNLQHAKDNNDNSCVTLAFAFASQSAGDQPLAVAMANRAKGYLEGKMKTYKSQYPYGKDE